MSKDKIVIIDVGTGNIRSVQKAFQKIGADVYISNRKDEILSASKAVLPGVGAFGDFMNRLHTDKIDSLLLDWVTKDKPLLGICVGMQAFFESSEEHGNHQGLGIIPGSAKKFPKFQILKVPQTGWNQVKQTKSSPLFKDIPNEAYMYFNHAYYCQPTSEEANVGVTDYGIEFVSVIQKNNLFGVQFHPEKSQIYGLTLLRNYMEF